MKKATIQQAKPIPRRFGRKPKHQMCNERCKSCVYATRMPSPSLYVETGCMYIVDEGHSRGCPAGRGCDKFVFGKRKEVEAI